MRSTTVPAWLTPPANVDSGGRPSGSCDHMCTRAAARTRAIAAGRLVPISPNARNTVVSDATGPNTAPWARSPSTSTMSRPPQAIITATSVSTRPRSWTGTNPRRASTPDNPSVKPDLSASIRSGTAPTIDATPSASAVTRRSRLHAVKSPT